MVNELTESRVITQRSWYIDSMAMIICSLKSNSVGGSLFIQFHGWSLLFFQLCSFDAYMRFTTAQIILHNHAGIFASGIEVCLERRSLG